MLDSWNQSIFADIKDRLQCSAVKLVHAERNGEAFDSQLVIGVRESYGKFTIGFILVFCFIYKLYGIIWRSPFLQVVNFQSYLFVNCSKFK